MTRETPALDGAPQVNEGAMLSTWTISTNSPDRDGDIVEAAGCNTKAYTRNGVVAYNHFRESPLPIGVTVGPITIGKDFIKATCRHHTETQWASDVWRLVSKGVLRGASISFLPLKSERLPPPLRLRHTSFELLEWSIVPIPANSEAIRCELSAGRIESPVMRKALATWESDADIQKLAAEVDRHGLVLANLDASIAVAAIQADYTRLLMDRASFKAKLLDYAASR